jgi:hypothetical protein
MLQSPDVGNLQSSVPPGKYRHITSVKPRWLYSERERERESTWGGGGVGNNILSLKVPRHCPLVILIRVRLEFRVNSTFFIFIFNCNIIGVGGAALEFSTTFGGLH